MKRIGIFDSGIGGLTVASSIRKKMPWVDLVYYGDTLHLPYGDKSPATIARFSKGICDFLIHQKHCDAVVIACNTASAHASDLCENWFKPLPIYNVIDPTIAYVLKHFSGAQIGIIATRGTISSGVYPLKIKENSPGTGVHSLATPLLCPLIEEGFFGSEISKIVLDHYLNRSEIKNIDALILACTHYPLLQGEIEAYYKGGVQVINSADVVAEAIFKDLPGGLQSMEGTETFYVSDFTDGFNETTKMFFGENINLIEHNIWSE